MSLGYHSHGIHLPVPNPILTIRVQYIPFDEVTLSSYIYVYISMGTLPYSLSYLPPSSVAISYE